MTSICDSEGAALLKECSEAGTVVWAVEQSRLGFPKTYSVGARSRGVDPSTKALQSKTKNADIEVEVEFDGNRHDPLLQFNKIS